MAVLKYKKKDGTYATLTNISIKGVDPKQTTGDSTTDVMSQAAITTYLGQKLAVSDFETYSGAVDTLIDGKASQGDLNTLNGVVTAHTANTTVHVTSSDKEKWNSVDDKLNTSDFNTYSGNVDTTINGKVDKIEGKGLSTNDYTTAEKEKLQGIAEGAEVNVNADWSAESGDAQILNKPTLGTAAAKGVSNGISNTDNLIESKHIYSGVGVTIDYVKTDNKIYLKSTSGSILASVDTTDFIKDGMVSNVEVKDVASSGTCLVITFNTDAGKDAINIPISDIFDASNYYTTGQTSGSTQISTALAGKSDTGHTHTISDVTNLQSTLNGKANTATTLSGYGITDANIANGVITLGINTITPLTEHQSLSDYYKKSELTGSSTTVVVAKAASATTAVNASTVNEHTVNADVPADAVFTDNNTTYAAGSFITITGDNNTINVSTGTTDTTVAVGNHNHSGVYQPVGNYLTAITSSDVTTALGYTPYNNTNPNGYTNNKGTVTSITAGTGLNGGTITSSGTIALQTIGTAGTYSQVVVDSYGRVTSGSTSGGATDANYFIIGSTEGSGNMPEFDAYTDTVHITSQVLTSAQKEQARANIDAENKVGIIVSNGESLSAEVNKYYRYDSAIGTLSVTLPIPSDSSHLSSIVISLTTSSASPTITFTSSANIKYQDGWAIDASSSYEINAVYNGSYWALAAIKLT